MGIVKDPLSFSRFRVKGDLPENFNNFFNEMIQRFSFQRALHDEKMKGWTSVDNPLDTGFEFANYAVGEYMVFSMRVDRKLIPPSLLKLRFLEEEKKVKTETGKKFLSRDRKEDLKEKVRLELASIIPAVPSFFEACWSLRGKIVYFCSLSPAPVDDFRDLFKRSFKTELSPLLPWGPVVPEPHDGEDDKTAASPGREFLVWLWFKSEERNGKIAISGSDVELIFLKRMVLESGEGEYSESVVCQGLNAALEEGKEALRKGKKIKEARVRLSAEEFSWEFTIKADHFLFQSMRMPRSQEMEEESDRDGRILERIALMEKAAGIMDELYEIFRKETESPGMKAKRSAGFEKWLVRR